MITEESLTQETPEDVSTTPEGETASAGAEQDQAAEEQGGDKQDTKPEDAPASANAGEEAGESNGDDAAADKDKGAAPPKKSGVQKRIDELVRERETERRAREMAEAELIRLREQVEGKKPEQQPGPQAGKPKPDDFKSYEDYLEALADFKAGEKLAKERQDTQAAMEREHRAKEKATFQDRTEKARTKYADFDDVVFGGEAVPVTQPMMDAIFDSEHGPDIAYHLGKHPDDAKRIAGLSPVAAIREIGKIEARFLQGAMPPEQKRTSKAPEPITPVGGAGASDKDPAKMTMAEYERWRAKRAAA